VLTREKEYLNYFITHKLGDGDDLATLMAAAGYGDNDDDDSDEEGGDNNSRRAPLPNGLTPQQHLVLLQGCIESVKQDKSIQKALGALKTLQVVVAQAGMRLEDIKALTREFSMNVTVRGVHSRTGKLASEAVIKYYEDSIKKRQDMVEKYSWKAAVLKKELERVKGESKVMMDSSSELMKYINFHQLRIENSQFTARLSEKFKGLLALKHSTAITSDLVIQLKGEDLALNFSYPPPKSRRTSFSYS